MSFINEEEKAKFSEVKNGYCWNLPEYILEPRKWTVDKLDEDSNRKTVLRMCA